MWCRKRENREMGLKGDGYYMTERSEQKQPIDIFFSYASEDETLRRELERHLIMLKRQMLIASWHRYDVGAGVEKEQEVHRHLGSAQIILLLISPDFLASDFCYGTELTQALERHEARTARVIPIIVRPVSWEGAPFGKLEVLPKDGVPIVSSRWFYRDEAWLNVVEGLRAVIVELMTTRPAYHVVSNPRIWHVPYRRNPFFTGREELLQQLHARLATNNTAALAQTHAINGLGGIGKTQLALEYAYRYQQDYRLIFWIMAATLETLLADFVRLAGAVGLPFQERQDTQQAVVAVKNWLAEQQEWLLIFDNVDDIKLISNYLPDKAVRNGHVILTTRSQATGSIAYTIEVTQMREEEGALLLLRRAKVLSPEATCEQATSKARAEAETIVRELDGLPLALDQAGAYIEETGCSFSGYLALYRRRRRELLGRRGHLTLDHPESVTAIWDLCFRLVEQANPVAADLLRLCAFLDPDVILEEIFTKGGSCLGPTLEPLATDTFALNQAIEELRKFSLVRRNAQVGLLSIHRLVQAVLKDSMEKPIQQQWAERAVRAVNAVFPEERWQPVQYLLAHALTCAEAIEEYQLVFLECAQLLDRTATYLQDSAQYAEAELFYKRALAIKENNLGLEHPDTAFTLSNLAGLYRDQARYMEAEPLCKQALAIYEHTLGAEHPDTAFILHNLARLYRDQAKYMEAEPLYKQALAIYENTLSPNHPDIATTLHNFAGLYRDQGKYVEAEPLYKRALAIRESQLGSDHPHTAFTLNNLARLYRDQKKYAEAEPLYKRSLAIRERKLGPDHPYTATTLNNLAKLYQNQGKYAEAEPLYRRALAIRERKLGPNHPNTAISLDNLARLYQNQGRCAEAEPLHKQALTIYECTLDPNHPYIATALSNLANLYRGTGRYAEAELLYKRVLVIDAHAYSPDHPEVAPHLEDYAALLQATKRDDEAATLLERVKWINRQS